MSWFEESTERRKTRFVKETVENADLHKAVLNKTMTTQELCVKYDFVAPLNSVMYFSLYNYYLRIYILHYNVFICDWNYHNNEKFRLTWDY